MNNMELLSSETDSYRSLMMDKELKLKYSKSMKPAIQAIEALNIKDNDEDMDDLVVIKKESVELCSSKFSKFSTKVLNKKLDTIWKRIDTEDRGYIESMDEHSNAIGLVAILYTNHRYNKEKNKGKNEEKPDNARTQKQARVIAEWVCKTYGNKGDDENKCTVSKTEFKDDLPQWIEAYAKENEEVPETPTSVEPTPALP